MLGQIQVLKIGARAASISPPGTRALLLGRAGWAAGACCKSK